MVTRVGAKERGMVARVLATLGVIVLLGLGTACGGPSKVDFARKANAICASANSELAGVTAPGDFKQLGETGRRVAAATEKQVKGIRQLDHPQDDKDRLEATVAAMDQTVAAARRVETGASAEDGKTVEPAVSEVNQAAAKVDDGARAYGLECGKPARDAAVAMGQSSPAILKQKLLAEARRICADAERRSETLSDAESLDAFDQLVAFIEKFVADMKALHVPQGQQVAYGEYLAALDKVVAVLKDGRAAVTAADLNRLRQFERQADAVGAELERKANAAGLPRECRLE